MTTNTLKLALLFNEIGRIHEEEGGNHEEVYLDSEDRPTAGVGHLLTARENRIYAVGDIVPLSVRSEWYFKDLNEAADDADAYLGRMSGRARPGEVVAIVYHMAFQLGRGTLFDFKETGKAIDACDYQTASEEMLDSKWYRKDSPERAMRLSERMLNLAGE